MLGDKTFPGETQHTSTRTDTDTTKVQLGEPVSFIGASYRHMGEGLFTGVEMTHRSLQGSTLHSPQAAYRFAECPFPIPWSKPVSSMHLVTNVHTSSVSRVGTGKQEAWHRGVLTHVLRLDRQLYCPFV